MESRLFLTSDQELSHKNATFIKSTNRILVFVLITSASPGVEEVTQMNVFFTPRKFVEDPLTSLMTKNSFPMLVQTF